MAVCCSRVFRCLCLRGDPAPAEDSKINIHIDTNSLVALQHIELKRY